MPTEKIASRSARAPVTWSDAATVAVGDARSTTTVAWGPCVRVLRRGQTSGTVRAVDPDGDPLLFSVPKAPKFGTVTLTAGGGFTYVADSSRNHDAFTIKVSDPAAASRLSGSSL